ncbi:hypothetical protein CEXT_199481 [Caerostris extrusa]|uniref:Uncharacterized protein n=1 Tax=Caerostris extrusa TaxID=172846 RepID=A0AAV4WSJ9_CAEEX|nr:hypothetical protein CEXT_199481 [Caerostris extrusa]
MFPHPLLYYKAHDSSLKKKSSLSLHPIPYPYPLVGGPPIRLRRNTCKENAQQNFIETYPGKLQFRITTALWKNFAPTPTPPLPFTFSTFRDEISRAIYSFGNRQISPQPDIQ